jgi:hypothetical protein
LIQLLSTIKEMGLISNVLGRVYVHGCLHAHSILDDILAQISTAITDLDLDAVEDIFNLARLTGACDWQSKRYKIVEGDEFGTSSL